MTGEGVSGDVATGRAAACDTAVAGPEACNAANRATGETTTLESAAGKTATGNAGNLDAPAAIGCPATEHPTPAPQGRILCAGLGPGAADLMSVRADRAIRGARHVAYFRKAGRQGQARRIVDGMLAPGVTEYPMEYPMTTEYPVGSAVYNDALARFYDDWADRLAALAATEEVVVLCEGDPFFYGSFMHLHVRLQGRVPVEVIPGITGMTGCWNALGQPMTWGDDVLTVLMGTLPEAELTRHMRTANALVVMKTGRNLGRVRRALAAAGRLDQAWLVERGTMPGQRIARLADMEDADCPYFAVVLVHGHGRRPVLDGGAAGNPWTEAGAAP